LALLAPVFLFLVGASISAQQTAPMVFDTYTPGPCSPNGQPHGGCPPGTLVRIKVVTVATGLLHPWHIAFLPGSQTMLVSELPGRLRVVRGGKADPQPVVGWPAASLQSRTLNSVLVHPNFLENRFVYFTYTKARAQSGGGPELTTLAVARGRFDGTALSDVQDVFVADAWEPGGAMAGRAEFGPDGMLYLTVGDRDRKRQQRPYSRSGFEQRRGQSAAHPG
jgi:glucose/arabinose dehydrogenase